jgi:AraC family transcriptional regulator of adaptative response/methylated-DNA-[protein]-cysteine methyltransferase
MAAGHDKAVRVQERETIMSGDYQRIEKAIHYLTVNFRQQPNLAQIAAQVGLSEFHFQRLFRHWAGVSPKRFLQFLTAEYARGVLQSSASVLEAAWEAGLSGGGRLHDLTVALHAATPGEIKSHGAGLTIRYGFHPTPFGEMLIAATDRGICALAFVQGSRAETLASVRLPWENADFVSDQTTTAAMAERIFPSRRQPTGEPLPLHVRGTNFQIKVWQALLCLPAGSVATYGGIAAAIGTPGAARAVGAAVGQNPVAWLIPCHRVIRKTGVLGEYRWGAVRKKAMLGWEAAHEER